MKILCDFCGLRGSSVFCCADEAALCEPCDRSVHSANKLASKHPRLSLLSPTPSPRCDVCQEKRALLFCQEDRAILCRDCDESIHSANDHTKAHGRFLLTGVRLSAAAEVESAAGPSSSGTDDSSMARKKRKAVAVVDEDGGGSFSEYLMKTLPGCCVEDLLPELPCPAAEVTAAAPQYGACKGMDEHTLPVFDASPAAAFAFDPISIAGNEIISFSSQQHLAWDCWGHPQGFTFPAGIIISQAQQQQPSLWSAT